ncbi:MAG: FG-GAP repeat protein [Alphaproteobacteria bacterium]|nr:FG-GAP repeat protein [Alphaproteobacteria bacterium]
MLRANLATIPLLLTLSALVACETATDDLESGFDGYSAGQDPDGYDNWWDDPANAPDVDRDFTEDGRVRTIPLGSNGVLSTYHAIWKGEDGGDRAGIGVAAAGDVNGDGRGDLLVGSIGSGGDGITYMNRSPFGTGELNLGASKGRYYGTTGANAGKAIAGGGDVDNNGQDDFIIGASKDATAYTNAGAAYLVSNYTRGKNYLPTGATTLLGDGYYDYFGWAVDVASDLNGDGNSDLLVTAPYWDVSTASQEGATFLFYGPLTADVTAADANAYFVGEASNDLFGTRVLDVGDTDGDGNDDFMVSTRYEDSAGTNAGAVYLFTTWSDGENLASSATAKITGEFDDDNAGNQIAAAGDVNGDGFNDFLVGALGNIGTGAAYLVLGPMSGTSSLSSAETYFTGQLSGDQFGSSMIAGDIDGDGTVDVVVGANRQGTDNRGAFYVFMNPGAGNISAFNAEIKVIATAADDYLGSWMDLALDTDFDGTDTLIVGASGRGQGGLTEKGVAYLFEVP